MYTCVHVETHLYNTHEHTLLKTLSHTNILRHTNTHTYTHTYTHTHTHTHTRAYTHTHTHTQKHTLSHALIHSHTHHTPLVCPPNTATNTLIILNVNIYLPNL